jgi:hypothetical protein
MPRLRLPLALALCAAACTPGGSARRPRAHVETTRFDGVRPETFVVRCRVDDAPGPLVYTWKLGSAVRLAGWAAPTNEESLLVQLHDPPIPAGSTVDCRATPLGVDGGAPSWSAWQSLVAPEVRAASGADRLTVDGSGFGAERGEDDRVWLVPARGDAIALDHGCAGASWSDAKIVGCVPTGVSGAYQVRVESAGRLGVGPLWTAQR